MRLAACAAAMAVACALAQAPEGAGQARDEAIRLGRELSAAGLAKLVETGNEYLVEAYAKGFREGFHRPRSGNAPPPGMLPPGVEAIIVARYADERVGPPLKGMLAVHGLRYGSRELFELRLAEWRRLRPNGTPQGMAHAVLATDAPGVEPALLGWLEAADAPTGGDAQMVASFLGKRRYRPALPAVLRMLGDPGVHAPGIAESALELGGRDAVAPLLAYAATLAANPASHSRLDEIVGKVLARPSTDLPDVMTIRRALPERMSPNQAALYLDAVRKTSDASGASEVAAMLGQPSQRAEALRTLLWLDEPSAWRAGLDEMERLKAAGRIDEATYKDAVAALGAKLRDPAKHLAEKRHQERSHQFMQRRSAVEAQLREVEKDRDSAPDRYVSQFGARLVDLEALVAEYAELPQAKTSSGLGQNYFNLAHFVRFRMKKPQRAIELYRAAERAGMPFGALGVADTYQVDLGDKARALSEYRRMLAQVRAAPLPGNDLEGSMQAWGLRWLTHQVAYLAEGKRFSGTLGREDIGGAGTALMWGAGAGQPTIDFGERSVFALAARASEILQGGGKKPVLPALDRMDPAGYATACLLALAASIPPGGALHTEAKSFFAERRIVLQTGPDPRMSSPEKTWALFLDSLRVGDLDRAMACLTPGLQGRFRPLFAAMSREELKVMADSFSPIRPATSFGKYVEAFVSSNGNGGIVRFVDEGGTWKINEM